MSNYFFVPIYFSLTLIALVHVLLYKRDPRSAMGWIMACLFVPFAGPLAYYLFGINRVEHRARGIKRAMFDVDFEVSRRSVRELDVSISDIRGLGERITGRVTSPGNLVTPLHNGDATYAAMLEAIEQAKYRVLLSTYLFTPGVVVDSFIVALQAAAARGVDVMVLVDGIGALYGRQNDLGRLSHENIRVAYYLKPKLFPPSLYLNLRNHRKLLIVDNDVAFAGGINISDDNLSNAQQSRRITDVHFSLRGKVVSEIGAIFYRDWLFATGSPRTCELTASSKPSGEMDCRVVPDGPDEELDALPLTIQTAISAASKSVSIMTPYFLPNRGLTATLQSAALRGVTVSIVLPAKNNLFYMHWAHRNFLTELLSLGVKVYYQPAPFCHTKLLCIDDDYSFIGSANLDPRSLRLNFEIGIEVFSSTLNAELTKHISSIIEFSSPVLESELASRSTVVRLRDSIAALFSPYF